MQGTVNAAYRTATVLLFLAPLTGGFGLWLIFPSLSITGNACLSCSSAVQFEAVLSPIMVVQIVTGFLFLLVGALFFLSSLGIFSASDSVGAKRWIFWLGRFRPNLDDSFKKGSLADSAKYRIYALAALLVVFIQDILLIPGIGEDRQYSLNQFSTLFLGPVFVLLRSRDRNKRVLSDLLPKAGWILTLYLLHLHRNRDDTTGCLGTVAAVSPDV